MTNSGASEGFAEDSANEMIAVNRVDMHDGHVEAAERPDDGLKADKQP